jgi:DNA polymerase-1
VTWRLHKVLKPRLAEEAGTRVYERVDRPLIPVVAQMERHGIKVDRQALAGLSRGVRQGNRADRARDLGLLRAEFTIGSPAQLGEVLFNKMGYKGGRKGKSGQYSTDQAILEGLANQGAPVARMVLEWRQLTKLGAPTPRRCRRRSTRPRAACTPATRWSGRRPGGCRSTDPNLQNIPIRTAIGRRIREAFVPERA